MVVPTIIIHHIVIARSEATRQSLPLNNVIAVFMKRKGVHIIYGAG